MLHRIVCALTVVLLAAPLISQSAGEAPRAHAVPPLKPGTLAPPLRAQRWLSELSVPRFEAGKVYVLDFLATSSNVARRNAPWMARLRGKYAGKVQFVGSACETERDNKFDELQRLAAERPELFDYPIAWDGEGHAFHAYFEASGVGAYPCSFVIDRERRVAFFGHSRLLDDVLEEVVAGRWDLEKGNARAAAAWKLNLALLSRYQQEPEAALTEIRDFVDREGFGGVFCSLRYQAFRSTQQDARAAEVCGPLIEELLFTGDFESLNDMAWCIADPANDCKPRDVELALRAAQRAVELTKQQDFAPLDTLARCWAWKGDFAKALSLEEHAIALAPAEYLPDLQRALDEYRAKTAKK